MTRLLVCPPTHFGVEYVINPWMAGNVGAASQANAMRQWDALVEILEDHADVYAIEPEPGLPDMCFAANGGLVLDETFLPSTFGVAQRGRGVGLVPGLGRSRRIRDRRRCRCIAVRRRRAMRFGGLPKATADRCCGRATACARVSRRIGHSPRSYGLPWFLCGSSTSASTTSIPASYRCPTVG